jgi:nucleotide-binding universal stress UspA family protein
LQRRGWQIRRLVRLGEPAAEILAAAEAEGVRAILLASRIPCGLGAPWQARVLQRLIARARVPVVVFYPGLGVQLAAQVADR